MADKPNTTALSRRAMFAGLPVAALGFGALLPATAQASAPSPVETAYREYERLSKATCEAADVEWELQEAYVEPPRPKVLHYRPGVSQGSYTIGFPDKAGVRPVLVDVTKQNIEELREILTRTPSNGGDGFDKHALPRRQKAAAEQLDAIEIWQAECNAARDACGLTKALDAANAAQEAENRHRDAFRAMPVETIRDLAFKGAALSQIDWDEEEAATILNRLAELVGIDV